MHVRNRFLFVLTVFLTAALSLPAADKKIKGLNDRVHREYRGR